MHSDLGPGKVRTAAKSIRTIDLYAGQQRMGRNRKVYPLETFSNGQSGVRSGRVGRSLDYP